VKVLFVCTGNVCRSPMAEGFLRHEAARRGLDIETRSTGTHAWYGRTATIDGRKVMNELGVPIDDHRTLELDDALVDWADLIIGMSREHTRDTVRAFPQAEGRTWTLKALLELLGDLPPYQETEAWLEEAWSRRDRVTLEGAELDVEDPIGERQSAYRRVATEIQELIGRLAAGLEGQ
jgi:protein arginine phosphatase